MKNIIAAVVAALALSNIAFAQDTMEPQQRQAFDYLVKYSPL
jgi:opacity protein-like surface antigen